MPKIPPPNLRFWRRVDKSGPIHPVWGQCWTWIGRLHKHGYGRLDGALAHRMSWEENLGPIPAGLNVLHRCDNRSCVNPAHLFLGTQQDNLADMREKGHQVRGELQGSSKVTEEIIKAIRKRYRRYSHKHGSGAMAKEFGLSLTEVWRIVQGQRWEHVK